MKPKTVGAVGEAPHQIPSYLGHRCVRTHTNSKPTSTGNSAFLQPDFRNANSHLHQGYETFVKDLPVPPLA